MTLKYYIQKYMKEFNIPKYYGPKKRNVYLLLLNGIEGSKEWKCATYFNKRYFSTKKPREKYCNFILRHYNKQRCSVCKQIKDLKEFYIDNSKHTKISNSCKSCDKTHSSSFAKKNREHHNYINMLRYTTIKQRTPSWSKLSKIQDIYYNCPEGYHVDHIIPLQGELVSGLHVPENLQYLPASENLSKGNRYTIE